MGSEAVVRIFVGSDERQGPAERALERSVRAHTSAEVEFVWMRSGDPGWDDWEKGRPKGELKSGRGWGTEFSLFRFAVPELCGFEGRAIYLDSDMLVLGDVAELVALPTHGRGVVAASKRILDVLVFDCAWFDPLLARPLQWLTLRQLKAHGGPLRRVSDLLVRMEAISPTLPPAWDCRDQVPAGCKLLHFTGLRTQPWRPHPERFAYREHPDARAREVWRRWSDDTVLQVSDQRFEPERPEDRRRTD